MPTRFSRLSFRNKLLLYATLTSSVALVLACTAFIIFDAIHYRESLVAKLSEEAQIIAASSTAAISFDDAASAQENLAALAGAPHIQAACLYDRKGVLFARMASAKGDLPPRPAIKDGHVFDGNYLHFYKPVLLEKEVIGTLYLRRGLKDENERLVRYVGISALVLVLSLGVAFLMSVGFHRAIARPVFELASVARKVSKEKDYSVRAQKFSQDEIGESTDAFNDMLTQIQEQTSDLQQAQGLLERRVQERTHDLIEAKEQAEASALSLKENEERIRSIMDTAADAILTVDDGGKITSWNRAGERIFGYRSEEIIGHHVFELIPISKSESQTSQTQNLLVAPPGDQPPSEQEVEGQRKNGERFPVALRVSGMQHRGERVLIWILQDISGRKEAEGKLADLNAKLVGMARQAGMAEVATGVLHNVGNVLNSVNVSANQAEAKIRRSRIEGLFKIVALLKEHQQDLTAFFGREKGKAVLPYLSGLADYLKNEREELSAELESLVKNIDHIKEIVSMQQSYAGLAGVVEQVPPAEIVEDALRLNADALQRHAIEVTRSFEEVPFLNVDKHKVLQILVNLIRNARYAIVESGQVEKKILLRIFGSNGVVNILVKDNGIGILSENLTRIFAHGFTTRPDGHGFGLHASALAAQEMGGQLSVESDGPGKGATFRLTLPVNKVVPATA